MPLWIYSKDLCLVSFNISKTLIWSNMKAIRLAIWNYAPFHGLGSTFCHLPLSLVAQRLLFTSTSNPDPQTKPAHGIQPKPRPFTLKRPACTSFSNIGIIIILIRGESSRSEINLPNRKLLREVEQAFIECLLCHRDHAVPIIWSDLQNNSLR